MQAVIVILLYLHSGIACETTQNGTDVAQQHRAADWRVLKWVRPTESCGLQKELAGNLPKASIFVAYYIADIQLCWARGTNTVLFSFLNVLHKNNSWKISILAGNLLKWGYALKWSLHQTFAKTSTFCKT